MDLSELRKEIDRVDEQMKALFIRRMGLSREIAALKAKTGDPIYVPQREKEIISSRSGEVDPQIADAYRSFLAQILKLSREYQSSLLGREA